MVLEDYDIFYFDSSDLPWEAQDAVIPAGQELFDGVPAEVEGGPPRARLELGRRDAVGEAELSGDAGFAEQGVVVLNPARPQILAVPLVDYDVPGRLKEVREPDVGPLVAIGVAADDRGQRRPGVDGLGSGNGVALFVDGRPEGADAEAEAHAGGAVAVRPDVVAPVPLHGPQGPVIGTWQSSCLLLRAQRPGAGLAVRRDASVGGDHPLVSVPAGGHPEVGEVGAVPGTPVGLLLLL